MSIHVAKRVTAFFRVVAGLVGALLACAAPPVGAQDTAESIDTTRSALEKWVETERLYSKEQRDLALAMEMLSERIELVRQEIESMREKIAEARASIDEAESKRSEFDGNNARLKRASASFGDILMLLEDRTLALLKQLPDPIRERVKPLSQRVPENPDATELSLSQRFQNVVGILNEVNKFAREITVTSEVRGLPDGTNLEVTALYVGIGQGYYVGAKGDIAGVGYPTEQGWTWNEVNEAAPRIAQAVAILNNEAIAAFVPLPTSIK